VPLCDDTHFRVREGGGGWGGEILLPWLEWSNE